MRAYVLKRVLSLVPTLIGVTILVFLMVRLIPGTVVDQMIGAEARVDEATRASMRAFFGLDQPLHVQYWGWLAGCCVATSDRAGGPAAGEQDDLRSPWP